ncbi:MAG: Ms5788A family Cys-rich leader peptide [Actinomycetes bacterium]
MASRMPRQLGLTQRRAVDLCRVAGCLCCQH